MTTETTSAEPKPPVMEHVHTWFSLSYSNYAVLPRTLLQSMPDEWQERFIALIDELSDAYRHIEHAPGYKVDAGDWVLVHECSDQELALAGVTVSDPEEGLTEAEVLRKRVDELLASRGVGWEFTAADLHSLLGPSTGKPLHWFRRELAGRLTTLEFAELVDPPDGRYRLTGRLAGVIATEPTYYDADGNEMGPVGRVFVAIADPVPHYNRGRTYIAPRLRETESETTGEEIGNV